MNAEIKFPFNQIIEHGLNQELMSFVFKQIYVYPCTMDQTSPRMHVILHKLIKEMGKFSSTVLKKRVLSAEQSTF